jgi:Zn-dependent protease
LNETERGREPDREQPPELRPGEQRGPGEREEAHDQPIGGLKIFRVGGIDTYINSSWLIIFALVAWSLSSGYFPYALPSAGRGLHWVLGGAGAILLFGCVLAHELTHSLVAKHEGLKISGITLFLFGGVSNLSQSPPNPGTELKIAISGPAASFVLGGVFYGLYVGVPRPEAVSALLGYLAVVNLLLGVFNIIPGFPLDGGRVLRAILWWKTDNLKRSTLMAAAAGAGVGWALVFIGLVRVLIGDPLGGVWMVLIGLFLRSAANYSAERAQRGEEV